MRGKKRVLVFGSVAIAAAVGGVAWLRRDQNYLRAEGSLPPGYVVIPRSAYRQIPFIDVNLPVFGHVVYPKRITLPRRFKDDPGQSGLLTWTGNPSNELEMGVWDIGGAKVELRTDAEYPGGFYIGERFADSCPIPYVFGKRPRLAKLPALGKGKPLSLWIPGNGVSAPVIPSQRMKMGEWVVLIEPHPWIGPGFAYQFDLTVESGPKSSGLIAFWDREDVIFVPRGQTRSVTLTQWSDRPQLWLYDGTPTSVTLKVRQKGNRKMAISELFLDGRRIEHAEWYAGPNSSSSRSYGENSGYLVLETPSHMIDCEWLEIVGRPQKPDLQWRVLPERSVIHAVGYGNRPVGQFRVNVPNAKQFPAPKRGF